MAPLPPDPYKILGVSKTAQIPDIRTAYRKLVLTCHPDKVQDPAQKEKKLEEFQKLQHAYELLSDEAERTKYDEQVKLMELRKEMSKNMPNTSIPRSPKTYNVSIRTETRPPYAQSPPQRVYPQPPRSPKDASYVYVEDKGMGRSARRSPSREKTSSRKEKDREEDRANRRRKEEREEHEREQRRVSEKEARKAEKKRREKERGHLHDEKRRHRSPVTYVEEYSDGMEPKLEKKKSSSRKHRERERERESTPKAEVIAGIAELEAKAKAAADYISRGTRLDPSSLRNSPPSVPTPPPPRDSPYQAPPAPRVASEQDEDEDEEEEMPHRSRAASRRGSFDPPRSKDRVPFLHRKSASSFHDDPVLSSSPGRLASMATESPPLRGSFGRASTFSSPKPVIPTLGRANTYTEGMDMRGPRGRSRSKHHPQIDEEDIEEEEDEEELRREEERRRRKHRNSRRDSGTEPMPIPYSKSSYSSDGRILGRESSSYRSSPDRYERLYHPSSSSSGQRVVNTAYYEPSPGAYYSKIKTTKRMGLDDVMTYRSYSSVEGYS
ncbi:uncharacterized protein DNG_01834 [Cephalotrichum gorgonifer]|uniref:J domain-containing protein n=1 Tax=Cephalotrichum gorgonifer TaxID=2041049 RepID=A0AAE8MTV2_9PEZI|nr:uncharacterized protein DNG_01834 [Cephalotrichum gorgonifer]